MSENEMAALRGQVEALEGWRAQMIAVQGAADKRLRPLLEYVPGALGRHVYDVAAEEIVRLRAEVKRLRATARHLSETSVSLKNGTATSDDYERAAQILFAALR